MNECVHSPSAIDLSQLSATSNDALASGSVTMALLSVSKGAARSLQNIPRGIECRRQCLGRFRIEPSGFEKWQYWHRRARWRLRRVTDLR